MNQLKEWPSWLKGGVSTRKIVMGFLVVWLTFSALRLLLFYRATDRLLQEPLRYPSGSLTPAQIERMQSEVTRLKRIVAPQVIFLYPFLSKRRRQLESGIGIAALSPVWDRRDYEIWLRGVTSTSESDIVMLESWKNNLLHGKRGDVHAPSSIPDTK